MDGSFPVSRPRRPARLASWRTATPNAASRGEWVLAFVVLVAMVSVPFLVGDQPSGATSLNPVAMLEAVSGEGDKNKQALLLSAYVACGIALFRTERPRAWLFIGYPCFLLLLWTFASVLWSVNPDVTIRRCIALTGTLTLGLYFGLRFEMRRLLLLLCLAGVTIMAFSLALAAVAPLRGLDFEGRLRGVADHKNHFASFSALVLLSSFALTGMGRGSRRETYLRGAAAFLAIVCMGLARSTSVLPVLAAALIMLAIGHTLLRASPRLVAIAPLAVVVVAMLMVVAVKNTGNIAEALGKDPDVSGRTLIWAFAAKLIAARPVEGYGLGAVWTGGNSPGAVFWAITGLGVPHAHNGYIQLTLELGYVGLALFGLICVMLVAKLIWLVLRVQGPGAPWSFGFLSLYLVNNYSEAMLWAGNENLMVVFIALVVRTNVDYRVASRPRRILVA